MTLALATHPDPFVLDPHAADVHDEGRRLRARGPLVPTVLEGGIRVWATGHQAVAEAVLGGRSFRKNPAHWADLQQGRVPAELGGILEFITLPGMLNEDGDRHRELRSLVGKAFTPGRIEQLRPYIADIVQQLTDDLAAAGPDELLDLRARFAFQLPMQVICRLFGLDPSTSDDLARDYTAIHDNTSTPAQVAAGKAGVAGVITNLIAEKRATGGDDLTTALIRATDGENATLDDELLLYTLMLFLFAGHETTQNLISNAIKALVDHPAQLARVRAGEVSIDDVVEETLRWNGPINTIMFRYASEPVTVQGTDVTVQAGEAVVVCVAASGQDSDSFGPGAEEFTPGRKALAQHLAFGHGVHYCIGAPLARMMARTALAAFVERFDLDRAGAPDSRPLSSYASNANTALWTRLTVRTPVIASS
jgi:cytochrome P450